MKGLLVLLLGLASAWGEEFEALFQKGRELSRQGKDLEALEVFRAAASLYPAQPYVHLNIGILLSRQKLTAGAIESFRRAAELAPEDRAVQHALGETLYWAGRVEEALPPLEKASAPPDPFPDSLEYLAAAYQALGRGDEAIAALSRYLELRAGDIEARLLLGEQLAGAKRYEEAIAVWKAGVEGAEKPAELLFRVGEALSRNRETYREAERYLQRALESDPVHLRAQVLLGRLLIRESRIEEGLALLEQAARNQPQSPEVYFALASAYQQLGRSDQAQMARVRFQQLTGEAERGEHREARIHVSYKRARELLDRGKMTEAEPEFRSLLELDPENAQVRSVLAKIAYSAGRLVEARQWIAQAIERDSSVGEYHYLAGLFAAKAGEVSEAESAVRRSLNLAPGFPDGWILLGSILADSGRPAEAVGCFLKAEALEPSNASVQLNLASAYHALGMAGKEQEAMERYRALTSSPAVKR